MKKIILVLLIGILGLSCEKKKDDNLAPLAALVLGSSSPTTGATITRDWGTFTDMLDGTVRLVVTAGTFGGQTYTVQTLFYAKCSHGQTYDAAGNTCTGTATTLQYCTASDNSCNGNDANQPVSSGALFNACNGLSLAGKTWRVPGKNELKLLIQCNTTTTMPNDSSQCGDGNYSSISSIFPNTPGDTSYWAATTNAGNAAQAWDVSFGGGYVYPSNKQLNKHVRCVSGAL